jgi:iron complex outermembrane receptor protein
VLPLGGVIYKITDEVSTYVSYTESLKPTSTIANFSSTNPTVIRLGDVQPEEGVQWETGIKFDQQAHVRHGRASTTSKRRTSSVAAQQHHQCHRSTHRGGQGRAHAVSSRRHRRLTDNWSMIGSYGYTDARVDRRPAISESTCRMSP